MKSRRMLVGALFFGVILLCFGAVRLRGVQSDVVEDNSKDVKESMLEKDTQVSEEDDEVWQEVEKTLEQETEQSTEVKAGLKTEQNEEQQTFQDSQKQDVESGDAIELPFIPAM